jgi:hypothetical protein
VLLGSVLLSYGCGRSHDLGVGASSSSGAGGAMTATSSASTSATTVASSTTGGGGSGGSEPDLPTAFTVVDGINDYNAVRFCFSPNDTPWPAAPAGLAFGAGEKVDIASAFPMGTDVTTWVIAGNLAATMGMTCTQIKALAQPADGGTAPIVAVNLATIPASTLTSKRSLLLVPTGCLGGPGHDDPNAASNGCGMGYTSTTPTPGVVLLGMSRIGDPSRLALQFVSASATMPAADFRVLPTANNGMEINVAPDLLPGSIGPAPPFHGLTVAQYGLLGGVQLKTYSPGTSNTTSMMMLSGVLSQSAFTTSDFVNGASFVFVALGGSPGAAAGPFWHAFTYALVKADP